MKLSEKDHLKKAEILNRIIIAANNADSLSLLLEEIVKKTIELMGFDGGGIYLIDESTRTARLNYHVGMRQDFLKTCKTVTIDDPRYAPVYISGTPIYAQNLPKKNPNMAETSGFESIMSIPVFSKEKIIGAMNIGSKQRHIISQFERKALEYLSHEIGSVFQEYKQKKD